MVKRWAVRLVEWLVWRQGREGRAACTGRQVSSLQLPAVIACPPGPEDPQPGLLREDAAAQHLGPGLHCLVFLSLENHRAEQLGEAGQRSLGPRARGPVEDELALPPDQERLLLRSWVSRWPHQPPATEAAPDRVPPELTLQYS